MRNYQIELEIFEGNGGEWRSDNTEPDFSREGICAWMYRRRYRVGQKFRYPEELGFICPWLVDSLSGILRVLERGGVLNWTYAGTPYEKVIDPEGVTTEFVRCLDPTASGVVIKVTRKALPDP